MLTWLLDPEAFPPTKPSEVYPMVQPSLSSAKSYFVFALTMSNYSPHIQEARIGHALNKDPG